MILIDENITSRLGNYLRKKGLEEVISVSNNRALRGVSDYFLGEFCRDYNGILITADRDFYEHYKGPKIFIENGLLKKDEEGFEAVYQQILKISPLISGLNNN